MLHLVEVARGSEFQSLFFVANCRAIVIGSSCSDLPGKPCRRAIVPLQFRACRDVLIAAAAHLCIISGDRSEVRYGDLLVSIVPARVLGDPNRL